MSALTAAAAKFFVAYPAIDTVLVTSDGNCFTEGNLNRARLQAATLVDTDISTLERSDLTSEIAAEADAQAYAGVTLSIQQAANSIIELAKLEPPEVPTENEAITSILDYLNVASLTNLPPNGYTRGAEAVELGEAVIATWYRSGKSLSVWAHLSQAEQEAAVAAEFTDWDEAA